MEESTDTYYWCVLEFLNTMENSWEQIDQCFLDLYDCMQVKGVLHITPFTNWVPDSVEVVKFSEGVEACAKISSCEHAAA